MAENTKRTVDTNITTVHGLKYLKDVRLWRIEKIFWAVALIAASIGFYLMIDETTEKFFSEKIVIKLSNQQHFIGEIPFPAITICPEYKFPVKLPKYLKHLKANSKLSKAELDLLLLVDMLYDQKILGSRNISHSTRSARKILSSYTQLNWFYENVAVYWLLQFKVPFSKIVTKWGLCMNFNLMPVEELLNTSLVAKDFIYKHSSYESAYFEGLSDPMPWNTTQTESALIIFIDLIGRNRNYIDSNMFELFEGFRIFVHNPNEFPTSLANSFTIAFLYYIEAKIIPELTIVDDSLYSMDKEKRNCFLPGEKDLKYFKVYTKTNCEQETLSLRLVELCGCSSFHLIRSPDDKICGTLEDICRAEVEKEFNLKQSSECLENCEVIKYQVKLIISEKANTVVDFTYESDLFYPLVKHRAFGFSDYIASVGGLLGLIAGISTVSFIELIYHMIKAFAEKAYLKVHPKKAKRKAIRKAFANDDKTFLQKWMNYFSDYMQASSIHGFSYAADSKLSVVEKVFWSSCVVLSSIFCVLLVQETTKRTELNPTSFGIDSKIWSVKDIPFPAFTFCPKFDGLKYQKYHNCYYFSKYGFCEGVNIDEMNENFRGISYYCGFRKHYKYKAKFDVKVEPEEDLQKQLEHFTTYDWLRNQSFCYLQEKYVKMSPVITSRGLCFSFGADENVLREEIVSKHFLSNNSITGECRVPEAMTAEKSFTIDLQAKNRTNCNEIIETVTFHDADVIPTMPSFYLEKTRRTTVILTPLITTTDESLRSIDPKIRKCYFPEEKRLRFFKKYKQENCYIECRSNATLEACGCAAFSDIRDNEARICSYEDVKCSKYVEENLFIDNNQTFTSCICLPDCNSIEYMFVMITDKISGVNDEVTTTHNFVDEVIDSRTVVRFGSDEYIAYKRFASYGSVELLSNIGGLLGLFLGISVLSLIELIYFFTLRVLNNICSLKSIFRRRRRNSRVIFL